MAENRVRIQVDTTEEIRRLIKVMAADKNLSINEAVNRIFCRVFAKELKGKIKAESWQRL